MGGVGVTTPKRRDPIAEQMKELRARQIKYGKQVTKYAERVRDKKIVAGRLVLLACLRHLKDRAREKADPQFPYRFNEERAGAVAVFFEDYLTLDDGRPFLLMDFFLFILGSIEGWVDRDGHQRFSTLFLSTAKGTAKTVVAAGYGLFCLCGKNEKNLEVYSCGVDAGQANYLYRFAYRMANRSDALKAVLDIGEHNIGWNERGSFFRPLSAEGKSIDNKRAGLAICDEVHEYPSAVIPEKMRLGFKGRFDALLFELTNTGHDKTSVCWSHTDYSIKVLEGVLAGPAADRWFAYICTPDPCEQCRAAGAMQPTDGCADCDNWTDQRVWPK